jgi:hypothetical protein
MDLQDLRIMANCFVCKKDLAKVSQQGTNSIYTCEQCGVYTVPTTDAPRIDENLRPIISGYIREHQDKNNQFHLVHDVVDTIQKMPIPTIQDKIVKLMRWVEKRTTFPGEFINLNTSDVADAELVASVYAKNIKEIRYYIEHLNDRGLITKHPSSNSVKISVNRFDYLESERKMIKLDQCFCAMSFSPEHNYIYEEFIQPAVRQAGYKCTRVDEDPHNNGVVDKIKAFILQSKFVIADLTGNKNGVYYEAGWADRGGQEVIFTCEKNDFHNVYFDVQHLPFIQWSKDRMPDAIEKLKWKIEGNTRIGRGSFFNLEK